MCSGELANPCSATAPATIINLVWATIGLLIRYYENIGLKKSNHKAQFISIYIASEIMELYTLKVKKWN
jgi:hypothetical protein